MKYVNRFTPSPGTHILRPDSCTAPCFRGACEATAEKGIRTPPSETARNGNFLQLLVARLCHTNKGGELDLIGGTDAKLIDQTLKGSEKAFRQLVERYHAVVYSVVRGVLGDRSDVDDVVQEVLIKMYRGLPSFRKESKLGTWLYRIARNEALNAARRKSVAETTLDDVIVSSPDDTRPDRQLDRAEERQHVDAYLSQLEENYRIVLELRYMAEKSYAEIGDVMDLPIGTVKSYIHRAKIELKRIMTKRTTSGEPRHLRES